MPRSCLSYLIVFTLVAIAPLEAASDVRASWPELGQLVGGKTIALTLPDGTDLRGKVIEVKADALVMDIGKTSNPQLHAKGRTEIPKASVRALQMRKSQVKWKVIGTAIGLGAGIAMAVPANVYAHNEGDGAPLAIAGLVAVPAALGFLFGWMSDRKTVTVLVRE